MKNYFPLLKRSPLFAGIGEEDLASMLQCLKAKSESYKKEDILLLTGQAAAYMGIVLAGRVQIVKEDFAGNRTILTEITPGNLFAEAFAFARVEHLPLMAVSVTDSEVLWLDVRCIASTCPSACPFHIRMIENMLAVLAQKNIQLNLKIEHISKRSTREKLLSYLSSQAARQGSDEFDIPFNRQELADYLCVDRSAMSAELSRMRKEGILRYQANRFSLLNSSWNQV
ncbi:MAG TPA: Crp/Fnr family transcriptional regulator [Clostridiales bacterium]|nr:Crp/Fnr family transcriptional regulator [Clostridiales bacterium]